MNASSDTSRASATPAIEAAWAVPDTLPSQPGAGIAWLSGASPRRPPPADRSLARPLDGPGIDASATGPTTSDAPDPETTRRSTVEPAVGWPGPGGPGGRPRPQGPGRDGWPGVGAGEVVTWLPDGRWVSATAGEDDAGDHRDVGRIEDPSGPDPGEAARRRGRRRVALARIGARIAGWPRRVAVVVLLLVAGGLALRPDAAGGPAPPAVPTADVVVAARDLAAGTELAAADLRVVPMPATVVPAGSSRRAAGLIGRVAAGAIRRGEPLTDARVVGPGLTTGLGPGESAAVPVRLADPDAAALVRAGDRVDVLGTPVAPDGTQATTGETVEVASGVRVLAVLGSRDPADGVVLVVATTPAIARGLAGAAVRHRLTVTVRPP